MTSQGRKSELHSLSVFFLPKDLLESLVPEAPLTADNSSSLVAFNESTTRTFANIPLGQESLYTHDTPSTSSPPAPIDRKVNAFTSSSSSSSSSTSSTQVISQPRPSCRVCGVDSFGSVQLQREHAKSDWHRYNLKHSLLDKEAYFPIPEHRFEEILQQVSSISASEESDYDQDDHLSTEQKDAIESSLVLYSRKGRYGDRSGPLDQAQISSLMKKLELAVQQTVEIRNTDPLLVHQKQVFEEKIQEARETPLIWFKSEMYGSTVQLGVYKNALFNRKQSQSLGKALDTLKEAQIELPPMPVKKIKMKRVAGAAAIGAATAQENKGKVQDSEAQVLPLPAIESPRLPILPAVETQQMKKTTPRYWTMLLLGGGHFAGMVVDLAGQVPKYGQGKNQNPTPEIKIVIHKTFHRYTVRKKNGGAQGTHGGCNSAGAMIRMYNETALKLDVRELVDSWKSWIDQSEAVFIHAPGNNRKTLIHDDSLIAQVERQGRLRSIPFETKRPTLTELKRAFKELTTIKVQKLDRQVVEGKEIAERQGLEKAINASQNRLLDSYIREFESESESDDDGEEESPRLSRLSAPPTVMIENSVELQKLVEMVKKDRVEAMSLHMERHQHLNPSLLLPQSPRNLDYDRRRTPTLLHLASHLGRSLVVQRLLESHSADPTVTAALLIQQQIESEQGAPDADGFFEPAISRPKSSFWTAYEVAKDKETRDMFRRVMAKIPERWDWITKAHVPSALTPDMEEKAAAIAAATAASVQKKGRVQEQKKTERQDKQVMHSKTKQPKTGNTLGSSTQSDEFESVVQAVRLSDEQRKRIDRERRAQAAEDRLNATRQSSMLGVPKKIE